MPRKVHTFREQMDGFPWGQVLVIAVVRISEPISFTSLFPYIYFMVKRLLGGDNVSEVARYAGYISGTFALCQSLTGVHWGRLSDRYGRKPVLIFGLMGSMVSLLLFGTSQTFWAALVFRSMAGLLNGNVGVVRTVIGEIATERRHQPVAFSVMPLMWQAGCVIGPMVGGWLADPVEKHPDWFDDNSTALFSKYPYLLSNMVVGAVLLFSAVFALLFLDETHARYKHRYDPFREVGKYISRQLGAAIRRVTGRGTKSVSQENSRESISDATRPLLERGASDTEVAVADDDVDEAGLHRQYIDSVSRRASASGYDTLSTKRRRSFLEPATYAVEGSAAGDGSLRRPSIAELREAASLSSVLTPQVRRTLETNFFLSLHTTVYDELLPIFLSTGIKYGTSLANGPFPGGLGLDSGKVGSLLSMNGFVGIFLVAFGYPYVERLFGTLRPFRLVMRGHSLIYLWTPFFVFLVGYPEQVVFVIVALSCLARVTLVAFSFPPLLLLVNRVAPKEHLGTVNGTVQMVGSFARALGPIIWGYLMETGQRAGHVELPWWTLSIMAIIPAFLAYRIHDPEDEDDYDETSDDD